MVSLHPPTSVSKGKGGGGGERGGVDRLMMLILVDSVTRPTVPSSGGNGTGSGEERRGGNGTGSGEVTGSEQEVTGSREETEGEEIRVDDNILTGVDESLRDNEDTPISSY